MDPNKSLVYLDCNFLLIRFSLPSGLIQLAWDSTLHISRGVRLKFSKYNILFFCLKNFLPLQTV